MRPAFTEETARCNEVCAKMNTCIKEKTYACKEGKMFANANFFLYNANFYDKIEENIRYITDYRKKRKLEKIREADDPKMPYAGILIWWLEKKCRQRKEPKR